MIAVLPYVTHPKTAVLGRAGGGISITVVAAEPKEVVASLAEAEHPPLLAQVAVASLVHNYARE